MELTALPFTTVAAARERAGDKPLLLDLFCGAGGAARGYRMAGFYVVGVDIKPQPRYAGDEFLQADAMTFPLGCDCGHAKSDHESWYGNPHGDCQRCSCIDWAGPDFVHASPPCQDYTPLRARQNGKRYPDLIAPVRDRLGSCGLPWAIENVPNSPLHYYLTLCGGMFGLRTYRHRRFECSWLPFQPHHPKHIAKTSTKKRKRDFEAGMHISVTGDVGSWVGPACMGIDWMTGDELSQAIPPAYTKVIGEQALKVLGRA